MPYTRRNATPYVPSPSETDLKARNIGITESLTASNINTLNLSVLGNVNGVLNAPQGIEVGGTLKVPTMSAALTANDRPSHAGLITVDTSASGKMYFSRKKSGFVSAEKLSGAKAARDTVYSAADLTVAEDELVLSVAAAAGDYKIGLQVVLDIVAAATPKTPPVFATAKGDADTAVLSLEEFEWQVVTSANI